MACIGCGLRENGVTENLEVATSEEFGSGDLAGFGGDDTVGAPIYCDSNGQIRTVPEHTSSVSEATGSVGLTSVGETTTVMGASATLTVNNPSAVRACSIMVAWSTALGVTWDQVGGGALWTRLFVALRNGSPYFNLNGAQNPANANAMTNVDNFGDNTVDELAAGGSVTYDLDVGVTTNGNGTSGSFTSSVSIRALCVTQ